uniref:Uncharacterized protein n=1 Tax=Globodera rostochiensis TaxID=31243 RepID=A0A914GZ83_GLORO
MLRSLRSGSGVRLRKGTFHSRRRLQQTQPPWAIESAEKQNSFTHNRSWNTEGAAASSSDKDSARITWTCFAIQIVAVCQLAYISAKMRKKCRQMIGKVWPFTTAEAAATDNDNGLRITQTQNIFNVNANNVSVNVVGSNRRWALQRS